jgi:hypothetical protein
MPMKMAMGIWAALGIALLMVSAGARAQDRGESAREQFQVTWAPRRAGVVPTIEGRVHNGTAVSVTDVRVQVDGIDDGGRLVGRRVAWALGDIDPGGDSSFVVETVPGAVTYHMSVVSFDVVSVVEAP